MVVATGITATGEREVLSLWTEMGTQTDADLDLGEYLLDTVLVWRPGYWHEANERWTQQGLGLRVALPG